MSLSQERTGDAALDRILSRLVIAINRIDAGAIARTHTVENVAIGTTDTQVPHGLGCPVRGWLVVRSNALATVCEGAAASDSSMFVNLKASTAVTVTLVFF